MTASVDRIAASYQQVNDQLGPFVSIKHQFETFATNAASSANFRLLQSIQPLRADFDTLAPKFP
jgi:hypothetical protein